VSTLGGLFNKAKAVETAAAPPPSPPPPPKTGFKIGGPAPSTGGGTAESLAGDNVTPPPTSPAKFKIGGASPSGVAAPAAPPVVDTGSQAPVQLPAATPRFVDETPASQPQRDLPPDVSEAVARFVDNLNHIHTLTPDPDIASSAIRSIMIELKSNPQYIKHVTPSDVRVMIQMMRETMGLAKATKEKKATTRKKANSAEMDSILAELSDLDDLG
jgi:hypothetical protein